MRVPNNTVGSVLDLYGSELYARYGVGEARAIVRMLFQEVLGWDVVQLNERRAAGLSESELLKVYLPLRRLRDGEPLHYVLGHAWFMGMRLKVSPGVLIPRPETEELVDHIGKQERDFRRIIDVGTGSGCIAIALKRMYAEAEVHGLDVSEEALQIARANGGHFAAAVEWQRHDALDSTIPFPTWCDLVVSNPPYIPRDEEHTLAGHVRDHEPHLALFVDDADPLLFYRSIAAKAWEALHSGGELWFEAHFQYAHAVGGLLRDLAYRQIRVFDDLSGSPRFIQAVR